MTSRLLAALAALVLWTGTAAAQIQPGGTAPSQHPGTHLNFPPNLGGAELIRSYTTPVGRDVHYVYQYVINKIQIGVFLFDNDHRVFAGSENPLVTTQFTSEVDSAEKAIKADGFTNFERPAVPSSCTYGSLVFRCIVYSALSQRDRVFSKLLLTGYNGYFLKIRADWNQGGGQTTADADKALQAFIPALVK